MIRLLVVYHSQSGSTADLAAAVVAGARAAENVEVRSRRPFDAGLADLLWCHGVLFGTPENFGAMSGALKDFFDRTFYPAQPHALNLPYAVFISAGNDGSGAMRQIERIAGGYPLKKALEPLIVTGVPADADLASARELGEGFATGLEMGVF